MLRTRLRSLVPWVAFVLVALGCSSLLDFSGDGGATRETGFIDGNGFFSPTVEEGTLPPLLPDEQEARNTESFFIASQIDPFSEDSAGPKFVVAADLNGDGLLDLASAWNQSQPVQIHLQTRDAKGNIAFDTVQVAGTLPLSIMSDIRIADIDNDGNLDIVVLIKHRGFLAFCPLDGTELPDGFTGEVIILFSPGPAAIGSADAWTQVELVNSRDPAGLPTEGDQERALDVPEHGGMTAMDVGDINGDGLIDIVYTLNVPPPPCHDGICRVLLAINPGATLARDRNVWATPITVEGDAPPLKDLLVADMDLDGDLDVIFTRPTSVSRNLRWRRNPLVEQGAAAVLDGQLTWEQRVVGQVDGGADIIELADIDGDNLQDVIVRSSFGQVIQWFQHPDGQLGIDSPITTRPNIPWPVFTIIDLVEREPLGIGVGDLNFDGQVEIILGAQGAVVWLDSSTAATVFDPWSDNLILDDTAAEDGGIGQDNPSYINTLLVVDLDGDGANDIIGTLDRRHLSGLGNDALVWFRNVLTPEDVGL